MWIEVMNKLVDLVYASNECFFTGASVVYAYLNNTFYEQ
jgi:hypothetical protein